MGTMMSMFRFIHFEFLIQLNNPQWCMNQMTFSNGQDASFDTECVQLQMMPSMFEKFIERLIQLFGQCLIHLERYWCENSSLKIHIIYKTRVSPSSRSHLLMLATYIGFIFQPLSKGLSNQLVENGVAHASSSANKESQSNSTSAVLSTLQKVLSVYSLFKGDSSGITTFSIFMFDLFSSPSVSSESFTALSGVSSFSSESSFSSVSLEP